MAGLFLGFYYVLLKFLFNESGFVNAIFWTRIGFAGGAFFVFFWPAFRKDIYFSYRNSTTKLKTLFVSNKILASMGALILYFSISIGNISIINAMLGVQFVFVLMLTVFFGSKFPRIKENINRKIITRKIFGIISVVIGLAVLFLHK